MTNSFKIKFKDGRVGYAHDPRGMEAARQEVVTHTIRVEGCFGLEGDDKPEEGIHSFNADEIESIESA